MNVIVEAANSRHVFLQDSESVSISEVLELNETCGAESLDDRLHKLVDERVVVGACQSFLTQTNVELVLEKVLVIRAYV